MLPCPAHLCVHNVLKAWLSGLGVDLVLSGVGELGAKGVVEGHGVAQVPQTRAIRLGLPLTHLHIWRRGQEGERGGKGEREGEGKEREGEDEERKEDGGRREGGRGRKRGWRERGRAKKGRKVEQKRGGGGGKRGRGERG